MRHRLTTWMLLGLALGCTETRDDRTSVVVSTLARADMPLIRTRPQLSSGKYARMASDLYGYYRGSLAIFARDSADGTCALSRSSFALDAPVLGVGDAHPENFGLLFAADGTPALEPNDFDAADRTLYLRDLRRLTVGMVIAAHVSNADDLEARTRTVAQATSIARATAQGYAEAMIALADGAPPKRYIDPGSNPNLLDLWKRGQRDRAARAELTALTSILGGRRHLLRGVPSPTEPTQQYADLPEVALAALPAALDRYRSTLPAPPPADFFGLLDATRVFGSGVASWAKVRALVLVRGPTDAPDDDVILELKELTDSATAAPTPPGVWFDEVGARVLATSRAAWARVDADPYWGVSAWMGFRVQLKTEAEANKTVRTSRMVGDRGTPEALSSLGRTLGALLARVHATPVADAAGPGRAIADLLRGRLDEFVAEQAEVSVAYAEVIRADHERFLRALSDLGPRLGIPCDAADAPRPDLAALFGTPSPPSPFCP